MCHNNLFLLLLLLFNCAHHMVTPGFVDMPRWIDCTASQMDGEAGWWTTSGKTGLHPSLTRVMDVGTQQQQSKFVISQLYSFDYPL